VIISASYKTDIPAFYGRWFMNRLRVGSCKMVNPYGRQIYTVSLARPDVDGFVFWTRNLGPFLPDLAEVHRLGYPFLVQYTITGYPRLLERAVASAKATVEHMKRIAAEYGPRAAVWRYDPVVFTSETSRDFHRLNFAELAAGLEGTTDEVVISFAQIYRKTRVNMDRIARESGLTWEDPADEVKLSLAAEFTEIARAHGMQLSTCSQNQYLVPGARPARCVDADRLSDVAGYRIRAPQRGNRPDCACAQSRDIGDYDTCPHGCIYCYAVQHPQLARDRFQRHDPTSEFLWPPESEKPATEV